MKQFKHVLVIVSLITVTLSGCKNGDKKVEPVIPVDPVKAILGKWEIMEMGNYPDMIVIENPIAYEEYCADSVLRQYVYETGDIYLKKYWIDSLLTEGVYREDGFFLSARYKFQFYDNGNKLRLDFFGSAATFNTFIYGRID